MGKAKRWPNCSQPFSTALLLGMLVAAAWPLPGCVWEFQEKTYCFFDERVLRSPLFAHFFNVHNEWNSGMPGRTIARDEKETMLNEWRAFFRSIAWTAEPEPLLFSSKRTEIETLRRTGAGKVDGNVVSTVVDYLLFMRDAAPWVEAGSNEWGIPCAPAKDEPTMLCLLGTARSRASDRSLHPFLVTRYRFQAVRLAALLGRNEDTLTLSERWSAGETGGSVWFRALGYRALALHRLGLKAEAMRIYLDIYDQYPPLLEASLHNLDWLNIGTGDWERCLALCAGSPHKQATVWLVRSLLQKRDYGCETLRHLVELEPASDRQEALLVRMIQTIEAYNFKRDFIHFFEARSAGKEYDELISFCSRVVAAGQVRHPVLWLAGAAYLGLLQGDCGRAGALLEQAGAMKNDNPYLRHQLHLLSTLLLLQQVKSRPAIDEPLERSLLDSLAGDGAWLCGDVDPKSFNNFVFSSLMDLCGNWFLLRGNPLRYAMCRHAARHGIHNSDGSVMVPFLQGIWTPNCLDLDEATSDAELQQLEDLVRNPHKNAFDAWLLTDAGVENLDLTEPVIFLRAVKWLRLEQYEKARGQFQRLSAEFWTWIDSAGNPIPGGETTGETEDVSFFHQFLICQVDPLFNRQRQWTQVDAAGFCRLLVQLSSRARQLETKDRAEAQRLYYALGSIWYNLKGMGAPVLCEPFPRRRDSRYMMYQAPPGFVDEYAAVADQLIGLRNNRNRALDNFIKAEQYFALAVKLDADRELSARCCFLINSCRNIYFYTAWAKTPVEFSALNTGRDFRIAPDLRRNRDELHYFYRLALDYRDTSTYREALRQCPVLRMFE